MGGSPVHGTGVQRWRRRGAFSTLFGGLLLLAGGKPLYVSLIVHMEYMPVLGELLSITWVKS